MANSTQPIIIKKVKKAAHAAPWRGLEDRLCRLRDRHDGVLSADVADQHDDEGAEDRPGELLLAAECELRPPAALAAS